MAKSKYFLPIKQPSQRKVCLSDEGTLTRITYESNSYSRRLSGANIHTVAGDILGKQLFKACLCRTSVLVSDGGKISINNTCKYRFCKACNRYTSIKRSLAYMPFIESTHHKHLKSPRKHPAFWFVTLTLPTCTYSELKNRISYIQSAWRRVYEQAKKAGLDDFGGLRKLEINPRPKKGVKPSVAGDFMYHVHLHLLICRRDSARFVRDKWVDYHASKGVQVVKAAQDIRKYYSKGKSGLMELMKYITKPVVTSNDKVEQRAFLRAQGFIYASLIARRTIFAFGSVAKNKACDSESKAWLKSLSGEQVESLRLGNMRKRLDEQDIEAVTKEGDVKRRVRPDKHYDGLHFYWKPCEGRYISKCGVSLTDTQDLDYNNPLHIDPKIVASVNRYETIYGSKNVILAIRQYMLSRLKYTTWDDLMLLKMYKDIYGLSNDDSGSKPHLIIDHQDERIYLPLVNKYIHAKK